MKQPASVNFVRESIITFISDSGDKVAAFIAFVYFANYFTTDEFGVAYTVIGMSMMAASAPKAVGIAISKRVSEDTRLYERYLILGIILILAFSTLLAIPVIVVTNFVPTQFNYLALAGLTHVTARPFLFHVERVFDGVGQTGAAATLDFIDGVLTSVLRFVLILGLGFGPEGLLYSGAISAVVVGSSAYFQRFGVPTSVPTTETFSEIRSYAGWTLLARVGAELLHNSATVLGGVLASPTLASWIKSSKTLVEPAKISVRSVINSIFVQVSGDRERGDIDQTPIQNGIDVASIFALPLLAGAVVLGDPLMVTVYGEGYGETGYVLVAVAAAMIFESQARIFSSAISGADRPDITARRNLGAALIAGVVFSGSLLIDRKDLFLITLVLSYAFWAMSLYLSLGHRVLKSPHFTWRFVMEQVASAVLMGLVVHLTVPDRINTWVNLILPISVGIIIYGATLLTISVRGRNIARRIFIQLKPM